jgi:predicted  nucleic acid-binding Zn-ribbon protein
LNDKKAEDRPSVKEVLGSRAMLKLEEEMKIDREVIQPLKDEIIKLKEENKNLKKKK